MRGDRRLTCQRNPILDLPHDEAGTARHVGPLGARITHAPVEADAISVDAMAGSVERFPNLGPGALALGGFAEADLRVHHHAPFLGAFLLISDLARDFISFEKWRTAD